MTDPDDLRPIRVMIFPARRDVMLIYAPEGQDLWLPRIRAPFDRYAVAMALGNAEIKARVHESTLGRFGQALEQAFAAEKSETAQQARLVAAARRVEIVNSKTATTAEKQRAELITDKEKIDAEVRKLRSKIGEAKAVAATTGRYMPVEEFRQMERRLADLSTTSTALQARIGQLKQQIQKEHDEREASRAVPREVAFIRAARRMLGKDMYKKIWARVAEDSGATAEAAGDEAETE